MVRRVRGWCVCILLVATWPASALAQGGVIPGRGEVEALLQDRGGISMTLPDLGYLIEDGAVTGNREAGSLTVTH